MSGDCLFCRRVLSASSEEEEEEGREGVGSRFECSWRTFFVISALDEGDAEAEAEGSLVAVEVLLASVGVVVDVLLRISLPSAPTAAAGSAGAAGAAGACWPAAGCCCWAAPCCWVPAALTADVSSVDMISAAERAASPWAPPPKDISPSPTTRAGE